MSFMAAWRNYTKDSKFDELPDRDRALIRVAFVAGWCAGLALPTSLARTDGAQQSVEGDTHD